MTRDPNVFHTYKSCHENFSVRIADGLISEVAGTDSVFQRLKTSLCVVGSKPGL